MKKIIAFIVGLIILSLIVVIFIFFISKANISVECSMNGFGDGTCNFTNTGTSSGTICGTVEVMRDTKILESSKFCSGEIKVRSTNQLEFIVSGVHDLCGHPWVNNCDMSFYKDDTKKIVRYIKAFKNKYGEFYEGLMVGDEDTAILRNLLKKEEKDLMLFNIENDMQKDNRRIKKIIIQRLKETIIEQEYNKYSGESK
jgi:hypothetical protein